MAAEADKKGTILMDKYELGRLLGKGSFAKVYYARNIETLESVAIKVIDKDKVTKVGLADQIKREISVMTRVRHPNIVQLHEVMATKSKIYFVLEYVRGGELFGRLAKQGRLREDSARRYFQQLISAVEFCHSRGVYHRDLKPENLLLDEEGNLKVSDFGLSALADSRRQDGLLHTACGTPAYVAPEVISRKGYDGAGADVWSCGVILFVLVAGYLPFQDSNLMEMYKKIGKGEFKCPPFFSSDLRKLLSRILEPNPAARITIARIMESPWLRKGLDSRLKPKTVTQTDPADAAAEAGEAVKLANMNAFDIISLSKGFDLSGMFEEAALEREKEARFTSSEPASRIMSRLEDVARGLKLKVKKKEGGGAMSMEGVREGRKGVLAIEAEVFEVTPTFHMVEIKKKSGDTLEYQNIWGKELRPALSDIVWAWQGEPRRQPQQQPALSMPQTQSR